FVHWTPVGDWALLELRTRGVGGSHTPLVGPYSRFGWSHPGPALFFALAIPYRLLGSRPSGLLVASLLINAASVSTIVLIAWRRGRRPLAVACAIALLVLCRSLGAEFLRDPWNPYVTVLPFAALVFLSWSIMRGDTWMLPIGVLVASFIVQSHVGYAVLTLVVLGGATVWRLAAVVRHRGSNEPAGDRRRGPALIGVTVAVTVAAWLPPLVDQIVNPGNLQALFDFFGKHHTTPTNQTAFGVVGRALTVPGAWVTGHDAVRTSDFTASASGFFLPVALVALVVAIGIAGRRRDRDAVALGALLIATLGAGVYSISHIAGPLAAYLVRWLFPIAMITWLVVVWVCRPWLQRAWARPRARAAMCVVAAVATLVPMAMSVTDAVRTRAPWYGAGLVEDRLARDTVAHLHTGGRPVLLTSKGDRFFSWGLAPRLEAAGIPVAARQADVLYYGRHRVARRRDARVALVVVIGPDARTSGRPVGGRLLAWHAGRPPTGPPLGANATYSAVIRSAERGLALESVAVYEVPL
ncbi:MAG TPA: hypothetical protein VIK61_07165, partial [Acidimicrobiia bacterium]